MSFGRRSRERSPGCVMIGRRQIGLVTVLALATASCKADQKPAAKPAAQVSHPVAESELSTVTLTEESARRLGIETTAVERRQVARARVFSGEVIVPPWREAHLTAPRAGYLLPPIDRPAPLAGQRVHAGEPLFRIVALPPEGDATRLQEDVVIGEARVANARARAERSIQLLRDSVGTPQEVEDAQVVLHSAEAQLAGAKARLALVSGYPIPNDRTLAALVINSPVTGVIERVTGAFNSVIGAGVEVVEVGALDSLWVKVQVYVGELGSVARGANGMVLDPNRPGAGTGRSARPVVGPPSADPLAASADLFYTVGNSDGWLRPHQRVGVSVPMKGREKALVVPWSAVVHDLQGGTWVYQATSRLTFARRRVTVRHVAGRDAVLDSGPAPGVLVVSTGAAELFGTEFGAGK